MTKVDLASDILDSLLDNGMITLDYGSEFYEQGKQDCINEIKRKLDDYVIVYGSMIE